MNESDLAPLFRKLADALDSLATNEEKDDFIKSLQQQVADRDKFIKKLTMVLVMLHDSYCSISPSYDSLTMDKWLNQTYDNIIRNKDTNPCLYNNCNNMANGLMINWLGYTMDRYGEENK